MENKGRIVIAGGSGSLGQVCADLFREKGYEIRILSRSDRPGDPEFVQWDPRRGFIADDVINGAKAIVNFCGVPLDAKRWTDTFKKVLYDSRVGPAEFLGKLLRQAENRPELYVGASGVAIYGDSGPAPVSEDHVSSADTFALRLAKDWEGAHPTGDHRTVILRIPPVFLEDAGFLQRLKLPASLGVYPHFGDGTQFMSWVHSSDLARVVLWAVEHEQLDGTYNATADARPLKDIIGALRKAKGGFGIQAGLPKFIADIVLGEMADILWESCNTSSAKLRGTGFSFTFEDPEESFRDLISP